MTWQKRCSPQLTGAVLSTVNAYGSSSINMRLSFQQGPFRPLPGGEGWDPRAVINQWYLKAISFIFIRKKGTHTKSNHHTCLAKQHYSLKIVTWKYRGNPNKVGTALGHHEKQVQIEDQASTALLCCSPNSSFLLHQKQDRMKTTTTKSSLISL